MLKIDKIKNCYGINGEHTINNLEFGKINNKKAYNNVIFGINMSGKTSFVKVLKSLKNNTKMNNILKDDGTPYAEITFNNKSYKYNNGWDKQFDGQLFICDKNFLNNSIAIIEKDAFIGVDVADLKIAKENKEKNLITSNDTKIFVEKKFNLKRQKDCTGYFSEIGFEGFFKLKNAHMDTLLKFSEDFMNNKDVKLLSDKEYEDSIDLFKSPKIDLDFVNKYLNELVQNIKNELSKYKIKTYDDQVFFSELLKYLGNNKPKECPVCLREFEQSYGLEDITKEIKLLISKYNSDDGKIKFANELNKLKNGLGETQNRVYALLSEVNEGKNLSSIIDEWPSLKNKLHELYITFPIYVGKTIKVDFGAQIDNYLLYSKQEKEILNNIKEVEGSVLIDHFIELKKKLSLDSMKDIVAELDPVTNLIKIKLKKTDLSIASYHKDNSSEGEKSILSLLFFFAYIKTVADINETMVLIFDDPIDSHDNYNKHFIIDMIMKNLSDLNVVSVILTHSSDVMRSIKMNYRNITNFYMMSSESLDLIFQLDNDSLAVFNGVFPFFKNVYSKKGNNIYLDMVSLLPIFRDIIEHAKTLNIGDDNPINFTRLYKDLSNDFLHFNLKDENKNLSSLFDIYNKYLMKFPYDKKDLDDNIAVSSMNVIEFIKHRRIYPKPHVSNLVESIKFKNILGLYLRWNIENIIYNSTTERLNEGIRNNFKKEYVKWHTVSEKMQNIKDKYYEFIADEDQAELNLLFDKLNKYKHVSNDFHHQINTYITPILETSLKGLLTMCDDIDALGLEFKKL